MNEFFFVFIALGIVIPFTIISRRNSNTSRVRRQLKNTALKPISQVKDGENVQISGHIEIVNESLIAPLSGRECAHYVVTVERRTKYIKSPDIVDLLIEEESLGKYLIEDNGRYAYVPEVRLISQIVFDKSYSSDISGVLEKKLRLFMEKYPDSNNNLRAHNANNSLEFKEGILELNEQVIVSGIAEWKSAVSLGLPAKFGRVLYVHAQPGSFSVISDDPKLMRKAQT